MSEALTITLRSVTFFGQKKNEPRPDSNYELNKTVTFSSFRTINSEFSESYTQLMPPSSSF